MRDSFNELTRRANEPTRRQFLNGLAGTFFGLSLGSTLGWNRLLAEGTSPARRPTAKNVITLFMEGGMSHIDSLDPKPGRPEQGPLEPVNTNVEGIRYGGWLPKLAQRADRCAVIRSMSSNQGAHNPGRYFMRTSYAKRATIVHPTIGSWLMKYQGRDHPTLPGYVVISGPSQHPGEGWLESTYAPLGIGNPQAGLQNSTRSKGVDKKRFDSRLKLLEEMNYQFREKYDSREVRSYRDFYDDALRLMTSRDLVAFDIRKEPAAVQTTYGKDRFGQGCLLARRLVEHGVRAVEVNMGGWDTHNDNFDQGGDRAAILDTALSALLDDLQLRGMLEETLVVLKTEFGRSPAINKNNGRDHHPKVFSTLLAGGGVHGGMIYGSSDERGFHPAEKPVTVPDFNATIAWALGMPLNKILYSKSGRPFTVADKGQPVTDLF